MQVIRLIEMNRYPVQNIPADYPQYFMFFDEK